MGKLIFVVVEWRGRAPTSLELFQTFQLFDELRNERLRKFNLVVHVVGLVDRKHAIFPDERKRRGSVRLQYRAEFFDHPKSPRAVRFE